jgi:hypothetical protein
VAIQSQMHGSQTGRVDYQRQKMGAQWLPLQGAHIQENNIFSENKSSQ